MPQQATNQQSNYSSILANEETKTPRKTRTLHNVHQLEKLEERYNKSHKIKKIEREKLGAEIGLSGEQVNCWFKNRRRNRKAVKGSKQPLTPPPNKPANRNFSFSSLLSKNSPVSPAAESATDESECENLTEKKQNAAHHHSIDKILNKCQQKTPLLAVNSTPNTISSNGSFGATSSINGHRANGMFPVFGFFQPFIGIPLAPLFTLPANSPAPVLPQHGYQNSSDLSPLPKPEFRKYAKYTSEQYKKLEKRFNEKSTIEQPEKEKFAAEIGLTSAQVAIWFTKRRILLRKTTNFN